MCAFFRSFIERRAPSCRLYLSLVSDILSLSVTLGRSRSSRRNSITTGGREACFLFLSVSRTFVDPNSTTKNLPFFFKCTYRMRQAVGKTACRVKKRLSSAREGKSGPADNPERPKSGTVTQRQTAHSGPSARNSTHTHRPISIYK